MKDWTGNKTSVHSTIGARNFATDERVEHDYYATDPNALSLLLELDDFYNVWECAVGGGHLADVLKTHYTHSILAKHSDLISRGYPDTEIIDFLEYQGTWRGDIITNPPYKYANQFIEKAMNVLEEGGKLALFLPIRYLEGKARKKLFLQYPPKTVYVSSSRISCARNGDFKNNNARIVAYGWIVWEKGYQGKTCLEWFN